MNYFKMAWRNLWRNKKRTLITIMAVVLAVVLSTFMSSMQEGSYSKMIDNIVKFYSGYLQIHQPNYWESKSINDMLEPSPEMFAMLDSIPHLTHYTPRIESFTLLSSGDLTKGSIVIGIDPEREDKLSELKRWIDTGSYLENNDKGILIAINLAKNLKVKVGDTLVLMSQGYHGVSAAQLFPVLGILNFPSPAMNSFGTYISLEAAREFFSAPEMVTSIAIMVDEPASVAKVKASLGKALGAGSSVMTWDEMQPEIVQMIEGDRAGAVVMKAVLYIVIAFGLFGTIIMMTSERKRENGIMIAIGMQRYRLQMVFIYETLLIGLCGVAIGFAVTLPLISYLYSHPLPLTGKAAEAMILYGMEPAMFFSLDPVVFINQLITVFVITIVVSLYPVFKVLNLKIINALHG